MCFITSSKVYIYSLAQFKGELTSKEFTFIFPILVDIIKSPYFCFVLYSQKNCKVNTKIQKHFNTYLFCFHYIFSLINTKTLSYFYYVSCFQFLIKEIMEKRKRIFLSFQFKNKKQNKNKIVIFIL